MTINIVRVGCSRAWTRECWNIDVTMHCNAQSTQSTQILSHVKTDISWVAIWSLHPNTSETCASLGRLSSIFYCWFHHCPLISQSNSILSKKAKGWCKMQKHGPILKKTSTKPYPPSVLVEGGSICLTHDFVCWDQEYNSCGHLLAWRQLLAVTSITFLFKPVL